MNLNGATVEVPGSPAELQTVLLIDINLDEVVVGRDTGPRGQREVTMSCSPVQNQFSVKINVSLRDFARGNDQSLNSFLSIYLLSSAKDGDRSAIKIFCKKINKK